VPEETGRPGLGGRWGVKAGSCFRLLLPTGHAICVNDFRTIFLLHDKRISRIVLDEIANLLKRNLLSPDGGGILRDGIAETLIPGSNALKQLLDETKQDPLAKNDAMHHAMVSALALISNKTNGCRCWSDGPACPIPSERSTVTSLAGDFC